MQQGIIMEGRGWLTQYCLIKNKSQGISGTTTGELRETAFLLILQPWLVNRKGFARNGRQNLIFEGYSVKNN